MEDNKNKEGNALIIDVMPSYIQWTEELKKKVETKPQIKNKWKMKRFKTMYNEGLTVAQAYQCWYCAHCWG